MCRLAKPDFFSAPCMRPVARTYHVLLVVVVRRLQAGRPHDAPAANRLGIVAFRDCSNSRAHVVSHLS